MSVWFQINLKMVSTILFRFDLKDFEKISLCVETFFYYSYLGKDLEVRFLRNLNCICYYIALYIVSPIKPVSLLRVSEAIEVPITSRIWVASTKFKIRHSLKALKKSEK